MAIRDAMLYFRLRHAFPAVCLLILSVSTAVAAPQAQLRGTVLDENSVPVVSVQVGLRSDSGQVRTVYTDVAGRFESEGIETGPYRVTLNKSGFFRLGEQPVEIKEGMNEITFTLFHEAEIHQSVEISSTPNPIEPEEPAHQEILVAREIRDIPVPNTHDLQSVLPSLPGIVRDNSGQLHVSGGRAGESQLVLDGFEIGDPISGALTSRVNVDTVRDVEVNSGRYGVQYGRGGAGVLVLDTTVGDDHWRAGTTNFVPGLHMERGVHLGNWYPRFTFSGPLEKGRAWFSEALSLQHTFQLVSELPANADTSTQWAGDNLLRAQINLTPHNLLQGSFLYNRQNGSHLGLGPFSPMSTTTDLRSQRSFVSIKDQTWTARALFDLGVAADLGHQNTLPMGPGPYIVQPSATSGNYFETLRQRARRWQFIGGVTVPSLKWRGMHNLQAGFQLERVSWEQSAARSAIEVERQDGTLLRETLFSGPASFHLADTQVGFYAQDSWTLSRPLMLQVGTRGDWDRFLKHAIASPRIAANIVPWRDERAKLVIAWGSYTQPLRMDILGPAFDQQRVDTFYDPSGKNLLFGPVASRFALPIAGLRLPHFYTTSVEWIQRIGQNTYAGANLIFREERDGFAYEPQPSIDNTGLFLLQNNRGDRYRAVQISLRRTFGEKGGLSANYTRSRASSNQVIDYSLATLVFAPQQAGLLEWDAPNRFVSTGWMPAPIWNLFLSYFFEYRTGFPFSVVNQQQQLVGAPNRLRFPDYMSLSLGVEKRFKLFGRIWAVRLAAINASGNTNPDSVVNNVDALDYLKFAGGQKRAFTARIRLVR
jgi:hypothetical protein